MSEGISATLIKVLKYVQRKEIKRKNIVLPALKRANNLMSLEAIPPKTVTPIQAIKTATDIKVKVIVTEIVMEIVTEIVTVTIINVIRILIPKR